MVWIMPVKDVKGKETIALIDEYLLKCWEEKKEYQLS